MRERKGGRERETEFCSFYFDFRFVLLAMRLDPALILLFICGMLLTQTTVSRFPLPFSSSSFCSLSACACVSSQIEGRTGRAGCVILVVFFHYFSLTNFFWMLVEGIYMRSLSISIYK